MNSKEVRRLIKDAEKWNGWRVVVVKNGWNLFPPDKSLPPINVHKTPSDQRAWKNTMARLRRAGAPV